MPFRLVGKRTKRQRSIEQSSDSDRDERRDGPTRRAVRNLLKKEKYNRSMIENSWNPLQIRFEWKREAIASTIVREQTTRKSIVKDWSAVLTDAVRVFKQAATAAYNVEDTECTMRMKIVSEEMTNHCFMLNAYREEWLTLQYESNVTDSVCAHCGTVLFGRETSTLCCANGAHILRARDIVLPAAFQSYYFEHRNLLIHNSRKVNNMVSISAVGVNEGGGVIKGGVEQPYEEHTLQINGRTFHFKSERTAKSGSPHLCSATSYLIDETKVDKHVACDLEMLAAVTEMRQLMRTHNLFLQTFRNQAHEAGFVDVHSSENAVYEPMGEECELRYGENAKPTGNQVVALWQVGGSIFDKPQVDAVALSRRHNVVKDNNKLLSVLKSWKRDDAEFERSTFVLLDPMGVSGWWKTWNSVSKTTTGFTDNKGAQLTLRLYMRYKAMQSQIFPLVPHCYQEWLLDGISRYEEIAQSGIVRAFSTAKKTNRGESGFYPAARLRCATKKALANAKEGVKYGKLWRIPSSVRGSAKHRKLNVDKGMAIVYKLGGPTLFITMTCNTHWREIVQHLPPGMEWYHCPDIVNRVFQEKLLQLIDGLKSGLFFKGRKAEFIQYTIEFQKRGCPHAHILVRLEGKQPTEPHEADELTSACVPDVCLKHEKNREDCFQCRLHRTVDEHMRHKCVPGRCHKEKHDSHVPDKECLNRTCNYGYPWPAVDTSFIGERGRWRMKRRLCDIDIVPYNPQLISHFDCHMNVEVSSSTRSIFYLQKYLSKGPDSVPISVVRKCRSLDDEMTAFYEHRCLTAFEASWQLLGFDFGYFTPSVLPLRIALPGEECVVFEEGDEVAALERKELAVSQMDEYFKRPLGEQFDNLKFVDYFARYRFTSAKIGGPGWLDGLGTKVVRRDEDVISYIENVSYKDDERLALYILLKNVPSRSFAELASGQHTLLDACLHRGLMPRDEQAVNEMIIQDMIERHTPADRILLFFATLLAGDSSGMETIFLKFHEYFTDIVKHRSERHAIKAALRALNQLLIKEGIDIAVAFKGASDEFQNLISEIDSMDRDALIEERFTIPVQSFELNPEQDDVLRRIVWRLEQGTPGMFYINGSAGAGKTRLLNAISQSLFNQKILMCAFTGVASSLLVQGVTAHRQFGLPVDDVGDSLSSIGHQSLAADVLRRATVIIIDEVAMLDRKLFELIDTTLRDICGSPFPFAGKSIILAGDFQQLPPVVGGLRETVIARTVQSSIVSSPLFSTFDFETLDTPCRFTDTEYSDFLRRVGRGDFPISSDDCTHQYVKLPDRVRVVPTVAEAEAIFASEIKDGQPMLMLAAKHVHVDEFNQRRVSALGAGKAFNDFRSYHRLETAGQENMVEHVEAYNPPGVPPHSLQIFVGMKVVLMRNIMPSRKLCNGSILTVVGFNNGTITCQTPLGDTVPLTRIAFKYKMGTVTVIRKQFPLIAAYGATINKSQGATLQKVILNLSSECFMHGQLYVALSRVRCCEDIVIVAPDRDAITSVVFKQILRMAKLIK